MDRLVHRRPDMESHQDRLDMTVLVVMECRVNMVLMPQDMDSLEVVVVVEVWPITAEIELTGNQLEKLKHL